MKEAASDHQDADESLQDEKSIVEGNGRNISFVVNEHLRMFLSYAYLISAEYQVDANTITCHFTSHKITLKGINLETLYYKLLDQTIRQITAVDSRYNDLNESNEVVVNEIEISGKES